MSVIPVQIETTLYMQRNSIVLSFYTIHARHGCRQQDLMYCQQQSNSPQNGTVVTRLVAGIFTEKALFLSRGRSWGFCGEQSCTGTRPNMPT